MDIIQAKAMLALFRRAAGVTLTEIGGSPPDDYGVYVDGAGAAGRDTGVFYGLADAAEQIEYLEEEAKRAQT